MTPGAARFWGSDTSSRLPTPLMLAAILVSHPLLRWER